jgi:hypothetical protein
LELPAGFSLVAPAQLDPIVAGSELIVGGRLSREQVQGDAVLRGTVDGQPFEQRYRLDVTATSSSGNAFVPRLFAAARIADLERDGSDESRREAVALSTEHGVASRFTSLLVLESEAMYKAFGLARSHQATEYTADLEADGSSASGELALSDDETKNEAKGRSSSLSDAYAEGSATGAPKSAISRSSGAAPSPKRQRLGGDEPFVNPIRNPGFAPPPAPSTVPSPPPAPETAEKKRAIDVAEDGVLALEPRRPRMIPMRRIWERHGDVITDRFVPQVASAAAVAAALRELAKDDSRRQSLKRAFALSSAAGDVGEASRLAERWVQKEPLDPEALTALADVEARRGHRDAAIRILGSVLDVRPGDTAAHKRLARLERWAGRDDAACRHRVAMAESKSRDLSLAADAVRCTRQHGAPWLAEALLEAAAAGDRAELERRASAPLGDDGALSGDVRVEASWSGGADLDVALLDTEGHRISWLGAATRSVISARDATSRSRESLALRGAQAGEYVLELTRGDGPASANGELVVTIAGTVRRIPFSFDGDRKAVALLRVTLQPRLVPL